MPDEIIYGELGRSLYEDGRLAILGNPTSFFSFVYPALVGPFLALNELERGYHVLKGVQALVMSLTAVPVYLWARSMARPGWALVAAVLTLAIPGLAFAGFVMTEVAFYPIVALVAWAAARTLERPTIGRQALLLAAVALACLTRLQAIVFLPALVLAVGLQVALDRTWLRGLRRFAPLLAVLVVAGAVLLGLERTTGTSALGAYGITAHVSYGLGDAIRFGLYHAADVLLLTALVPVVGAALLAARAFTGDERDATVRAYVAVTSAVVLGFVAQVGLFASRLLGRLAERNLIGLAPLAFVGFAVWLDRGAPRPRLATAAVAAAALGLLLYLPYDYMITQAAEPDAFTTIPLFRLRETYPDLDLRLAVCLAAVGLLALVVLLPRRVRWLLPATALVLLAGASISASRVVARQATLFRPAMVGDPSRWIDIAAGGPVTYVYGGELAWSGGAPVWMNVFWNRRVRRVVDLPGAEVVGPVPQLRARVASDGRLVLPDGRTLDGGYVVAAKSTALVGELVTLSGPSQLALWRAPSPLRLASTTSGFEPTTGELAPSARLVAYDCHGGRLDLAVFATAAARVVVRRSGREVAAAELAPGQSWAPSIRGGSRRACDFEVQSSGAVRADRFAFERGT